MDANELKEQIKAECHYVIEPELTYTLLIFIQIECASLHTENRGYIAAEYRSTFEGRHSGNGYRVAEETVGYLPGSETGNFHLRRGDALLYNLALPSGEIEGVIGQDASILAEKQKETDAIFAQWRDSVKDILLGIQSETNPKELIRTIAVMLLKAWKALDDKVEAKYKASPLGYEVDGELESDIREEIEQVLNSLSSKVLLIAKRYEHTLGEIEDRTAKSRAAVVSALERMGYKW